MANNNSSNYNCYYICYIVGDNMSFEELVRTYLRDLCTMGTHINIISLIHTVEYCIDINAVTIDSWMYNNNSYAINVHTHSIPKEMADYVIWIQYQDEDFAIVITCIRNKEYSYMATNCNDHSIGQYHSFKQEERKYLV